jgi:hypothetical protein
MYLKIIHFMLILVATASVASASSDKSCINFLAGFILLQENTILSQAQKAEAFSQLQKLTGVSTTVAIEYVESFRNKPEMWKSISKQIISDLTGISDQ